MDDREGQGQPSGEGRSVREKVNDMSHATSHFSRVPTRLPRSRDLFRTFLILVWCALVPVAAFAQAGAPTRNSRAGVEGQSTLRVTVRDETESALIHATVTLTDGNGVPRQV